MCLVARLTLFIALLAEVGRTYAESTDTARNSNEVETAGRERGGYLSDRSRGQGDSSRTKRGGSGEFSRHLKGNGRKVLCLTIIYS